MKELEDAARRGELSDRVVAPFVVTDRSGRRLFDVDEESGVPRAQVYNSSDIPVAGMWAVDAGGQFITRTGPAGLATYLGIFGGSGAGLRVLEGGKTRVSFGKDADSGQYLLKLFSTGGNPVAAIGENKLGTGSGQVAGVNGNVKALMTVNNDGKGAVSIFNAGGKEVAYLTEGAAAGGLLTIKGGDGSTPMVEAGVADGVGIVRAGPYGFKPGLGLLGLPGSYIMGKR